MLWFIVVCKKKHHGKTDLNFKAQWHKESLEIRSLRSFVFQRYLKTTLSPHISYEIKSCLFKWNIKIETKLFVVYHVCLQKKESKEKFFNFKLRQH